MRSIYFILVYFCVVQSFLFPDLSWLILFCSLSVFLRYVCLDVFSTSAKMNEREQFLISFLLCDILYATMHIIWQMFLFRKDTFLSELIKCLLMHVFKNLGIDLYLIKLNLEIYFEYFKIVEYLFYVLWCCYAWYVINYSCDLSSVYSSISHKVHSWHLDTKY